MNTNKIVCIYHNADMDGRGSAAVVNHYHKQKNERVWFVGKNYEPFNAEDFLEEYPALELLYVVDYSLKQHQFKYLLDKGVHIVWCDHHKTAIEEVGGIHQCYTNFRVNLDTEGRCAAVQLTWETLFPEEPIPEVVTLISVWDAWLSEHPMRQQSEYFNIATTMYETWPNKDIWDELFKQSVPYNEKVKEIVDQGKLLQEYKEKQDSITMNSRGGVINWEGINFFIVNASGNSKTCDQGFDPETCQASLMYYYHPESQQWKVSLYHSEFGDKELDLSPIATKYGGGGHAGACGFSCKDLPFILTNIISLKTIKNNRKLGIKNSIVEDQLDLFDHKVAPPKEEPKEDTKGT